MVLFFLCTHIVPIVFYRVVRCSIPDVKKMCTAGTIADIVRKVNIFGTCFQFFILRPPVYQK